MIQWADISTAPKDGTRIIGFPFFGEAAIAYWCNGCWWVDSSSQDGVEYDNVELTHWSEANTPIAYAAYELQSYGVSVSFKDGAKPEAFSEIINKS